MNISRSSRICHDMADMVHTQTQACLGICLCTPKKSFELYTNIFLDAQRRYIIYTFIYHHVYLIPKLNESICEGLNELAQVNHLPPKWFGSKELSRNLQECMVASTVVVSRCLKKTKTRKWQDLHHRKTRIESLKKNCCFGASNVEKISNTFERRILLDIFLHLIVMAYCTRIG